MKIYSDFALWWLLPICGLVFLLSVWFYRKTRISNKNPKLTKNGLIILRTLGVFSLVLLLFGLFFEIDRPKTEKPIFINLIDNSQSMLNYSDSSLVKSRIEGFTEKMNAKFGDKYAITNYYIGDGITNDSLNFSGQTTDLNEAFNYLFEEYYNQNIGAINVISDGVYNSGINPTYSADRIKFTPIYSLGVGDTLQKVDHLVKAVNYNKVNYYKNKFPIEIYIESYKLGGREVRLKVFKNGKLEKEERITYKKQGVDFQNVSLLLKASSVGINEYTVQLEEIENEVTLVNNKKSFFIETIDSRNKILIVSDAPHPDISAIKTTLEKDENNEVVTVLTTEFKGDLNNYEMAVIKGNSYELSEISRKLSEKKTAILYLLSKENYQQNMSQFKVDLKLPRNTSTDMVQAKFNEAFQLFELSDELKRSVQLWPPLTVRFGEMGTSNGIVMFNQSVAGVNKKSPLMFFGKNGASKYGVITGENFWRWKIANFQQSGSSKEFNELIFKVKQYLSNKKSMSPLQVELPDRINTNEELYINASIFNASLEPIVGPDINLVLTNKEGKERKLTFTQLSNSYGLDAGRLSKGIYSWQATTIFNGKTYSKKGEFIVSDISMESLSTKSNFNLLKKISQQSRGKFYPLSDYTNVLNDIEKRDDIVAVQYSQKEYEDLISMKWIIALIVLFFGVEWFIRKYNGLI